MSILKAIIFLAIGSSLSWSTRKICMGSLDGSITLYGYLFFNSTTAGAEPFGGFLQKILQSQQSFTDTRCFLVA
jgi:hypothetical protein